ncbi:MAG: hypothetical protein ACRC7O_15985 [Fimbriiglobus sp.]
MKTSITTFGPIDDLTDTSHGFVDRTADELCTIIDLLASRPDMTLECDGMLGDKACVSIHKNRATLHLYFPRGDTIRYEYADPSDGAPYDGQKIKEFGYTTAAAAKEAVRLMADGGSPDMLLRAHTLDDDVTDQDSESD